MDELGLEGFLQRYFPPSAKSFGFTLVRLSGSKVDSSPWVPSSGTKEDSALMFFATATANFHEAADPGGKVVVDILFKYGHWEDDDLREFQWIEDNC
jgi:hypothetical protein